MLSKSEQRQFYQQLGQTIKTLRSKKKIKKEALGRHLGFTRNSISNIESGRQKIQLHSFLELAKYLQVNPSDLFPRLDAVRSSQTSAQLEKKLSNSEVFDNAESVEKLKGFIRFSTSKTK